MQEPTVDETDTTILVWCAKHAGAKVAQQQILHYTHVEFAAETLVQPTSTVSPRTIPNIVSGGV